jgi:hypothetical protein
LSGAVRLEGVDDLPSVLERADIVAGDVEDGDPATHYT